MCERHINRLPLPRPSGDLSHNPGVCPDWESNWRLPSSQAGAQSTELHQLGPSRGCDVHSSRPQDAGVKVAYTASRGIAEQGVEVGLWSAHVISAASSSEETGVPGATRILRTHAAYTGVECG